MKTGRCKNAWPDGRYVLPTRVLPLNIYHYLKHFCTVNGHGCQLCFHLSFPSPTTSLHALLLQHRESSLKSMLGKICISSSNCSANPNSYCIRFEVISGHRTFAVLLHRSSSPYSDHCCAEKAINILKERVGNWQKDTRMCLMPDLARGRGSALSTIVRGHSMSGNLKPGNLPLELAYFREASSLNTTWG